MPQLKDVPSSHVPQVSLLPLGLQYLVAGRFLALQLQVPVAGNLYHHAIEMFLKAALAPSTPARELASRKLGHNLGTLWDRFKTTHPSTMESFDTVVEALDRFEEIRYPEARFGQGPQLHLAVHRQPDGKSMAAPSAYAMVVEDLDALAQHIVQVARMELTLRLDFDQLPDMSKRLLLEKNMYPQLKGAA